VSVRIARLEVRNFGPLRVLTLEPADVTVVYGANETGKTSCIDALARALRDKLRTGNRKLIEHVRDGAGYRSGEVDLVLSPPDGGSLAQLLREHPSLARLFIVRDSDSSLEGGRGWLAAIRDRLIGVDLKKVADHVRAAASLTATGAVREARAEDRRRISERLARLDAFVADLPAIGTLAEEISRGERNRLALRARAERLRAAERYHRYALASDAARRARAGRAELAALERYTAADLQAWREAVAGEREALALERSATQEVTGRRDELTQVSVELRIKEAAFAAASQLAAECDRRRLDDEVRQARALRDAARVWEVWRSPLSIASLLLLALAIGLGLEGLASRPTPASMIVGLVVGASTLAGLATGIAAIYLTTRLQAATAKGEVAVARCAEVLPKPESLDDCAALISRARTDLVRAEAERVAVAANRRTHEAALAAAEGVLGARRAEVELAEREIDAIRRRVDLAEIAQLEDKLHRRERAESAIENACQTMRGLLGVERADAELGALVEALQVPDPGIAANPSELHRTEDETESLDERLAALRGELTERRDRQLGALGLRDLGELESEKLRLEAELASLEREMAAARLCLEALRELADDVDLPLREALGSGPGAAGAYLSALTGGAYRTVIADAQGGLEVERSDGQRFSTDVLSHGARDQLALAVRLALTRRLLGEPAFLVLDDAFLSSDPARRKALIAALGDLAAEGWQIVYFTLDPELRDQLVRAGATPIDLNPQERLVATG
jgi:hypothetical protein